MMTEIQTIDGGQKYVLLGRANIKKVMYLIGIFKGFWTLFNEFFEKYMPDIFSVWLPTHYQWWVGKEQSEILYEKNSNTIELTVHTSCYWVLDLLCVNKNIVTFTQCFHYVWE